MTWWRYVDTHPVQSTWREPKPWRRVVVMPRGPAVSYDGWRWENPIAFEKGKEPWANQSPNFNDKSD